MAEVSFFDASSRVPLILRLPSISEKPGRIVEEPVGLIDLFPSFCDIAGVVVPSQCQGLSLIPALRGQKFGERDAIFSESVIIHQPNNAGCMLRSGKWKYNYYLDGREELYDLSSDPNEWSNLANAGGAQTVRNSMRKRVIEFWGPDQQLTRYHSHPKVSRQKHFYEFSNQFLLNGGTIVDARP